MNLSRRAQLLGLGVAWLILLALSTRAAAAATTTYKTYAAYKTAVHCKVFGIPVRFVVASELPGMTGITTHAEVTKASKRLDPAHAWWYTHLDPGPLWPRRRFMRLVRQYHAQL